MLKRAAMWEEKEILTSSQQGSKLAGEPISPAGILVGRGSLGNSSPCLTAIFLRGMPRKGQQGRAAGEMGSPASFEPCCEGVRISFSSHIAARFSIQSFYRLP